MTRNNSDNRISKYTDEELADSFVFKVNLTKNQKTEADETLKKALAKKRKEMSGEDVLQAKLLQLRFQIAEYVNDNSYDKKKSFGYFLGQYINALNKKNIAFSREINLKPSELSQYLNNHRKPPKSVLVRLELHSQKTITAIDWYKLVEKENIQELKTNTTIRKQEQKNVKAVAALAV